MRKSQIQQAIKGVQKSELEVFDSTMSPYIKNSNLITEGFLLRLERMFLNSYNSVDILDNIYNYTKESNLND